MVWMVGYGIVIMGRKRYLLGHMLYTLRCSSGEEICWSTLLGEMYV